MKTALVMAKTNKGKNVVSSMTRRNSLVGFIFVFVITNYNHPSIGVVFEDLEKYVKWNICRTVTTASNGISCVSSCKHDIISMASL